MKKILSFILVLLGFLSTDAQTYWGTLSEISKRTFNSSSNTWSKWVINPTLVLKFKDDTGQKQLTVFTKKEPIVMSYELYDNFEYVNEKGQTVKCTSYTFKEAVNHETFTYCYNLSTNKLYLFIQNDTTQVCMLMKYNK